MSTYQPVTVDAAKQIAEHFAKSIVVITAYDREHDLIHTTTYGVEPEDKIRASQLGEILLVAAGGELARKETFEDFREVDAAKSRRQIETLTEKLGQSMAIVTEFVDRWDETWCDPDELNHEWAALYQLAKALVSQYAGGPNHGS